MADKNVKHYEGRFGKFDYNADDVDYILDELAVSEEYHSKYMGEVSDAYIEAVREILDHDYEKYEHLVEDWQFTNGIPEGYISSKEQYEEMCRRIKSDKKSVDVNKVLSEAGSIGTDNVDIDGIDK